MENSARKSALLALVSVFVASLAAPSMTQAQSHFQNCASMTGDDATLIIPTAINPTVAGSPLASGDEIAVFTPRGTCAGAGVWDGSNMAITIWGDDIVTSDTTEGFVNGEALAYRVWDASSSLEYGGGAGVVSVTYSQNGTMLNSSGSYASNSIYELASLSVTTPPAAPTLTSPQDGATGLALPVTIQWSSVSGANSYDVQVSSALDFQSLIVDQSGLTTTNVEISSLANSQTYYWRVRGRSSTAGPGPYSSAFSFTTASDGLGAPSLLSPINGADDVSLSPTLSWSSVAEALSYDLHVTTAADFSTINVLSKAGLTTTSYTLDGLENDQTYYWRVRAVGSNGQFAISQSYQFATTTVQTIPLSEGWNMISSYVEPPDTNMESVLAPISSSFVLVKDGDGGILWPEHDINTIGTWKVDGAHVVFVNEPASLPISGSGINPQERTISLASGWNFVAYWGRSAMEVSTAVQSVANKLVAVKDVAGNIYLPEDGVDNLGDLQPGSGYMIYVSQPANLKYPASQAKSGSVASTSSSPGLASSASLIVNAPGYADGEIFVVRSGMLEIGRAAVADGRALIVIRGDDPLTQARDGALPGNSISLMRIRGGEQHEVVVEEVHDMLTNTATSSDLTYEENGIWSIDVTGQFDSVPHDYSLAANYPNPFNPSTTIEYTLKESSETKLAVYNMLGQRVAVLVNEFQEAGNYQVRFEADDMPSGHYLYRIESGGFVGQRNMVLSK